VDAASDLMGMCTCLLSRVIRLSVACLLFCVLVRAVLLPITRVCFAMALLSQGRLAI
jgi:hypothetical protein